MEWMRTTKNLHKKQKNKIGKKSHFNSSRKRNTELAVKLEAKLEQFLSDQKKFEESVKKEMEELKDEVNGALLLKSIGYIYEQEANRFLGGLLGFAASVGFGLHTVSEVFSVASKAYSMNKVSLS